MPRGAAVIRYEGARGVVWRIKYVDATGRQVQETLGREADGWTRKKAEAELRERLVRVERKGYRRPQRETFADYAGRWFDEGTTKRCWRDSTARQYRSVRSRLVESLGHLALDAVRPRHVADYIASMSAEGYGASTIARDVSILHAIFVSAMREELVEHNPAAHAERPRLPRRSWRLLEPVEVSRVARAFRELVEAGEGVERAWLETARVAFLTLILTGVRRSELQALRWADVDLVENVLRVRDSKSEQGVRAIAIPPALAEELWQRRRATRYRSDEDLVFCHPERGTTYRAEPYAESFRAALKAAGVEGYIRPFHDARHTSITNDAASGASAIAVMTRAGHANMSTTKTYLHLAGTVFREEAERLERRLLGGSLYPTLYPPEPTPADPSESKPS